MSGVVTQHSNELLCHYCCESSGNVPCNLEDKPDQIEQFIQPTTTTIKPTTIPTTLPPTTTATTIATLPTTTSKYYEIA